MIIQLILKSMYFFLPAYIANMAPVLVKKIPFLNRPIHRKLFGENKTWRGAIAGTAAGGLIFYLQKLAYASGFKAWALIDYLDFSVTLGLLLGAGAIVGDLVESYYKRKAGIKSGEPWFVFDQIDFVIGGLVFAFILYVPPAEVSLILLIVSPLLHLLVKYIGYKLGIEKNKI